MGNYELSAITFRKEALGTEKFITGKHACQMLNILLMLLKLSQPDMYITIPYCPAFRQQGPELMSAQDAHSPTS